MPGYEVDLSTTKIEDHLLCSHCDKILREPYQTLCGHRYCFSCIKELRGKGKSFICVLDKAVNGEGEVFPDRFVQRQIITMTIACKNKKRGCPWTGDVKYYDVHLTSCEYEGFKCPNSNQGCDILITEYSKEKHLEVCAYRKTICPFCSEKVIYAYLQKHQNVECPLAIVQCPSCKKDVQRSTLEMHKDHECEEFSSTCPFSAIGCAAVRPMKRTEKKKHLESDFLSHLLYILQVVLQIKSQQDADNNKNTKSAGGANGYRDLLEKLSREEIEELQKYCQKKCEEYIPGGKSDVKYQQVVPVVPKIYASKTETSSSKALKEAKNALVVFEDQPQIVQDILEQSHRLAEKVNDLEKKVDALQEMNFNLKQQLIISENEILQLSLNFAEREQHVSVKEGNNDNGQIIFPITNFSEKREKAILGHETSFYSEPFYTSRHGYRLRVRVYLNGDGMGKGSHISLYVVIEKGAYDALLPWPFNQRVTFTVIDQNNERHITEAFRPDPESSSFHRPRRERNIASGCPLFMPLTYLDSGGIVKDDVMFIRAVVDTSGLQNF